MNRVTQGGNGITQKYKPGKHLGVDIGWKGGNNDNILAHSDGVVVEVVKNINWTRMGSGSYGNYVKLRHDSGYYTLYAHMAYNTVCVNKGDRVTKGQKIGYIGNTGQSNGKHLHFEVRTPNNTRIDPTTYLNADLPQTSTKYTGPLPTPPARGYFKKGDRGEQVKNLQRFLNWNLNCNLQIDGCIGNLTLAQIKNFQKKYNLTQDGYFGPACFKKMKEVSLNG